MPTVLKIFHTTKNLLTREQNNILQTSFFLMFIIIITKLSGFLSNAIVSNRLGATRESDLFLIANTLPEIIGNLILVGAISAALMPILIKAKNDHGTERFLKIFNSLLNTSLIVFIIISLILVLLSNQIFPFILNTIIRTQFEYSQMDFDRAAQMMRILMIPQVLLGVSAFYTSALNVHQRFLIPQLAPFFYNVGRVIGAYFFIPIFNGAEGLAWGTLLGALFHFLIQVPLVYSIGVRHSVIIDYTDKYYKESMKVLSPRIIGLGGEQIANGFDRFIAARFIYGSVTALDYAVKLVSIPLSLFGLTFSVAAFPTLSTLYHEKKFEEFHDLLMKLIQQILFLSIPVTVVLLVLRVSLVRLFYGIFGGKFDLEATHLTAWVVSFFAIGLVFESVRSLLYRAFYAANDTIRPMYAAIFTVVLGVATGVLFTNYFSHFNDFEFGSVLYGDGFFFTSSTGKAAVGGVALSSSLVYILEFWILIYMLNKNIIKLNMKLFFEEMLKKIFAGGVMALAMFSFFKLWGDTDVQAYTLNLILLVSITSTIGIGAYLWASYVLQISEFKLFKKFLQKVLPKKIYLTFSRVRHEM